jgi:hypothetical protein
MRQSVITLIITLLTACGGATPEQQREAQKFVGAPPTMEEIAAQQYNKTCQKTVSERNASISKAKDNAEQRAQVLKERAIVIQEAIGNGKIVSTVPVSDVHVQHWQEISYTINDCEPLDPTRLVGVSDRMTDHWSIFNFDGSAAGAIAFALDYGIPRNGWVNVGYDSEWSNAIMTAFRDAAMDPQVLATAGAAGRRIIPVLNEDERAQVRTLVHLVLGGIDDGYTIEFPLTVDLIANFGDWAERTEKFELYSLEPWEHCAYDVLDPEKDEVGNYVGYNADKCGQPPEPPKNLRTPDTDEWMLWKGDGSLQSIFVRRWMQAGGGQKGDYLIWSYRVWAVVFAHDLGLTSARQWAQEVRDEAAKVGNGFGKAQYLAFLDKVTTAQKAALLDEKALGNVLTPPPPVPEVMVPPATP